MTRQSAYPIYGGQTWTGSQAAWRHGSRDAQARRSCTKKYCSPRSVVFAASIGLVLMKRPGSRAPTDPSIQSSPAPAAPPFHSTPIAYTSRSRIETRRPGRTSNPLPNSLETLRSSELPAAPASPLATPKYPDSAPRRSRRRPHRIRPGMTASTASMACLRQ